MSDSPAKKLNFESSADKENIYKPIVGIPDMPEEVEDASGKKPSTASTIKPEEAHEPLLQENPHRFVLFPIKYHDVSRRVAFPPVPRPKFSRAPRLMHFTLLGLANVQEG